MKGLPIAATGSPTTTVSERPSGTGCERVAGGVDPNDGDVAEEIPAHDPGRHAVAVTELDVELGGAVHGGPRPRRRRS